MRIERKHAIDLSVDELSVREKANRLLGSQPATLLYLDHIQMINFAKNEGLEKLKPVKSYKDYLYTRFDDELAEEIFNRSNLIIVRFLDGLAKEFNKKLEEIKQQKNTKAIDHFMSEVSRIVRTQKV